MTEPRGTFPLVTADGWPYGLSCLACNRQIGLGQPYRLHQVRPGLDAATCVYCCPPPDVMPLRPES